MRHLIIYLVTIISLSSCATMFGGTSYNAQIVVKDNPKARIYYNGQHIGTGKAITRIPRNLANQLYFEIEEDGYLRETKRFVMRVMRGWAVAGSVITWGYLGIIVDGSTGALWKPSTKERGVVKTNFTNYNYVLEYNRVPDSKTTEKVIIKEVKSDLRTTEEKLHDLKKLLDEGIINEDEYTHMKQKVLGLDPSYTEKETSEEPEKVKTTPSENETVPVDEKTEEVKKEEPTSSETKEEEKSKAEATYEEKLKDLDKMLEFGIITEEEHKQMKEKLSTEK